MKATIGRVENCQDHQATPRYTLRLARTREEVEADLRLRFEVFNLELQEGFAESFFTGIDGDEFDRVCEHLIVTGGSHRTKNHQNRCIAPCLSAGFSARSLSEEATSRCNVSSRPEINGCRPDQADQRADWILLVGRLLFNQPEPGSRALVGVLLLKADKLLTSS